jgi:hypothetical protein
MNTASRNAPWNQSKEKFAIENLLVLWYNFTSTRVKRYYTGRKNQAYLLTWRFLPCYLPRYMVKVELYLRSCWNSPYIGFTVMGVVAVYTDKLNTSQAPVRIPSLIRLVCSHLHYHVVEITRRVHCRCRPPPPSSSLTTISTFTS